MSDVDRETTTLPWGETLSMGEYVRRVLAAEDTLKAGTRVRIHHHSRLEGVIATVARDCSGSVTRVTLPNGAVSILYTLSLELVD